ADKHWFGSYARQRAGHPRRGACASDRVRGDGLLERLAAKSMKRGFDVLRDKTLNRSITFRPEERDRLGLTGLLPYSVATPRQMVERVIANLERLPRDIDRYTLLSSLQERNQQLFFQTLIANIERLLPIIYTPTVGEACREFSH